VHGIKHGVTKLKGVWKSDQIPHCCPSQKDKISEGVLRAVEALSKWPNSRRFAQVDRENAVEEELNEFFNPLPKIGVLYMKAHRVSQHKVLLQPTIRTECSAPYVKERHVDLEWF
jgi:hypothetical protein